MTTKKATKRVQAKKTVPVTAANKRIEAQRNSEAFKILETIVSRIVPDALTNEGRSIMKQAAKVVGSKRFTTGTVEFALYSQTVTFDDLEEDDEFTFEVIVTKNRTGKTAKSQDAEIDYVDTTIDY